MKLQGVIILRITDFQRFFDLDEFLVKKQEFIELMSQYGSRRFCDSSQERDLCGLVRNWINGDAISADISDGKFTICGANGRYSFPLGVLEKQIEKYRDKLGFKDLYGLTALCLLAGANKKGSTFAPDYGAFLSDRAGWSADDTFISLHKDIKLPKADSVSDGAFSLRVLANINSGGPLIVSFDAETITLKEGQCIAGIFSQSGCVTLLNREVKAIPGIYATLMADKAHKRSNLMLSHDGITETIPGVSSVWIESGAGVAYVTANGEVVYDRKKCYKLNSRMSTFLKNANGRKLLSVKKTDNGNYVIYTDTRIEH